MNYINKIRNILTHLDNSIRFKQPFSLIRFGDGGIKVIHAFIFNDREQLVTISKKEGIPLGKYPMLMNGWAQAATYADYIDTQEMYFDGRFWPRVRTAKKGMTKKTKERMEMWSDLYGRVEFKNYNYCNPESNYLSVIRVDGWRNILDIMKGRKVCIITAKPKIKSVLLDRGYDVEVVKIVGHYKNQYKNSYDKTMEYIEQNANSYDLFLCCAGELGRIYSGHIKKCGGRCFDLGYIAEFWCGESIHPRLKPFLIRSINNFLELKLTDFGRRYIGNI